MHDVNYEQVYYYFQLSGFGVKSRDETAISTGFPFPYYKDISCTHLKHIYMYPHILSRKGYAAICKKKNSSLHLKVCHEMAHYLIN